MMPSTYEARELARLPVPNCDGWIRLQVKVSPEGLGPTQQTRWLTISFEQFAQIQNVLDVLPAEPENVDTFCDWCQTDPGPDGECDCPVQK